MNTFQDQQIAFQNTQLNTANEFQQHQFRTNNACGVINHNEVPAEYISAKEATDNFFNMDSFDAEWEERKRLNRERFEQNCKANQEWFQQQREKMNLHSFGDLDNINSLDDVRSHFMR